MSQAFNPDKEEYAILKNYGDTSRIFDSNYPPLASFRSTENGKNELEGYKKFHCRRYDNNSKLIISNQNPRAKSKKQSL